jgi:hypothetical protein
MNDPIGQVRALRQITYDDMKRQLHEAQKNANLRSSSRGFMARKDLTVLEKKVAEAEER